MMNMYQQQQRNQICSTIVIFIVIFAIVRRSSNNNQICIGMVESFGIVPKYFNMKTTYAVRSITIAMSNNVFIQQQHQRMMLIDRYRRNNDRRHVTYDYYYKSLVLPSLFMKDNDENDITTTTTTAAETQQSQSQQQTSRKQMGELTKSEQIVYNIMNELVQSNYTYRIIVMSGSGGGSSNNSVILECTVPSFGPMIKILQSPSTGANMVTITNHEQTFEYHIQLDTISKINFVEKNTMNNQNKTLRIIRLLNQNNNTISSIILMDTSDHAQNFFQSLIERYGNEIQL